MQFQSDNQPLPSVCIVYWPVSLVFLNYLFMPCSSENYLMFPQIEQILKNNASCVNDNDENQDPQKDLQLAKLICHESMPSMPEIMRIGIPFPYKKTYCGMELVYDPAVLAGNDEPVPCEFCAEEPAGMKCYGCKKNADYESGRFSLPADPPLSPCYAIGRLVREKTLEPEDRGLSIRRTGASAGDDIVPDSQPGTPVNRYDAERAPDSKPAPPVDAGGARLAGPADASSRFIIPTPTNWNEVIPTPVEWRESEVFVMRASGSPIRLRRFSPVKRLFARAASEEPEDSAAGPPCKTARTGSAVCDEA